MSPQKAEQQPALGSCIEKGQTGTELCQQKCSQQSREVDIPLYSLPVRLHLESLGQIWVLKYNISDTEMVEGLEHTIYKEKLREPGLSAWL